MHHYKNYSDQMSSKTSSKKIKPLISLVIPCYNEEAVIELCHERVSKAITSVKAFQFELIYVNDGSQDNTLELLKKLKKKDKSVKIINLSRNFGKEAAMTAGIDCAKGEALIILDADLQDPPELIPDLINIWQSENADVVYGQRTSRKGETWFKKFTACAFYKVINFISRVDIPVNTGDFRLMSRRAVNALNELREHHRFMKGLFAWIGYKQVPFQYVREPRVAGRTKWDYIKLWNLSLEGITGFSMTPLRVAFLSGVIISVFSVLFGLYILIHTLTNGNDVPGYPSLMVVITFLSGIQLLTIGILGEYIGRIFNETKHRPLYFIEEFMD
jgi:glycosyltransferase involved in cell wall biosynthesis